MSDSRVTLPGIELVLANEQQQAVFSRKFCGTKLFDRADAGTVGLAQGAVHRLSFGYTQLPDHG